MFSLVFDDHPELVGGERKTSNTQRKMFPSFSKQKREVHKHVTTELEIVTGWVRRKSSSVSSSTTVVSFEDLFS